jgi:MFS family permease
MLVATTLPSAINEFGGAHLVSWAFTLYLLGSILAGSSIGLVVSLIGLKPALLGGAILYGIGSSICAIAPGMEVMLLGRFLQGLGGGGLVALTYVAVNRMFPRHLMSRLMALISAVWSISAFYGPLIGGSFATFGNWRDQIDIGPEEQAHVLSEDDPSWLRLTGPNQWPVAMPEISAVVTGWAERMNHVSMELFRALAIGLGHPYDDFDHLMTPNPYFKIKISRYPVQHNAENA